LCLARRELKGLGHLPFLLLVSLNDSKGEKQNEIQ